MRSLLKYWRSCLADANRTTPRSSDIADFPEFDQSEFLSGQLNERLTKKCFQLAKQKDDLPQVDVLLLPHVFSRQFEHGVQKRKADGEYVAVLGIPAKLGRNGVLTPVAGSLPFIGRQLLSPILEDIAIGELAASDRFHGEQVDPLKSWIQTIEYCEALLTAVTGKCSDGLSVTGYERVPEGRIQVKPLIEAKFVLDLYDAIERDQQHPPLLANVVKGSSSAPCLDDTGSLKADHLHIAQMSPEHALSPTQRIALRHFLIDRSKDGAVIAVNGPPGTGKTTLLQSVVANVWTSAALREQPCPLIPASSTNNQAVTNIIDSFGKVKEFSSEPLYGRWLPGISSYGAFLPAASRKTDPGIQVIQKDGDFTASLCKSLEDLVEAEKFFLEKFTSCFRDEEPSDVKSALSTLHRRLKKQVEILHTTMDQWGWLVTNSSLTDKSPSLLIFASEKKRIVDALAQANADEKHAAERILLLTELAHSWDSHKQTEPFLTKITQWLVWGRRRRLNRDQDFFLSSSANAAFVWIDVEDSREAFESMLREKRVEATKSAREAKTAAEQGEQRLKAYSVRFDPMAKKFAAEGLDGEEDDYLKLLDTRYRYRAFKLATHYWEAAYLIETKADLIAKYEDKRSREKVERRYRRLAKLAPCFVCTLHSLPNKFAGYSQTPQGWAVDPLYAAADLLIIDEAGQVSPEIGVPSFALARTAIVVGDTEQIAPVWNVSETLDRANFESEPHESWPAFSGFSDAGLASSSGSLMRLAQRACRFSLFPDIVRGLYLREHRRCVDELITFCNELSYHGLLQPKRGTSTEGQLIPPWSFHDVCGEEEQVGGSRRNKDEARRIVEWIETWGQRLVEHYVERAKPEDRESISLGTLLAVVTPFSVQASLIESMLNKCFRLKPAITVGTVHRLQGGERRVVLFSSVYGANYKGTPSFIDRRMLNVAVSRAQDSFVLFGRRELFGSSANLPHHRLFGKFAIDQPKANIENSEQLIG